MTQKQILLKILQDTDDWVVSWQLIKTETKYGWLGTGTMQTCRAMEADGLIFKQQNGKYVEYKIAPLGIDWLEGKKEKVVYNYNGVPIK